MSARKLHRVFAIVAVLAMVAAACSKKSATGGTTGTTSTAPKTLNVAAIFISPVDEPWNTAWLQAWDRVKAEHPHGLTINVTYTENVAPPDAERVLRQLAQTGKRRRTRTSCGRSPDRGTRASAAMCTGSTCGTTNRPT